MFDFFHSFLDCFRLTPVSHLLRFLLQFVLFFYCLLFFPFLLTRDSLTIRLYRLSLKTETIKLLSFKKMTHGKLIILNFLILWVLILLCILWFWWMRWMMSQFTFIVNWPRVFSNSRHWSRCNTSPLRFIKSFWVLFGMAKIFSWRHYANRIQLRQIC